MKISVIISTIPERAIFLSSILSNLARQNYLPDEVLVITDNGKWEGIREIIPDELFPILNLRVLESDGEGLSRARNKGVEASTGDILVFIDDDVVIPDNCLLFRVREVLLDWGL